MKALEPAKLDFSKQNSEHKGENGRIVVIGGSPDYVGCVYLAALAALRSGADIVEVIAPEKVAWAINCSTPDLITHKVKAEYLGIPHFNVMKNVISRADVLLFGNGLGTRSSTAQLVNKLSEFNGFKVIDADALKLLKLKNLTNAVLTPHFYELKQLLSNNKIRFTDTSSHEMLASSTQRLLKEFLVQNNVVLLKGRTDYLITKEEVFYNKLGNSRLRVAGTGDVLAGVVAGVLAQTKHIVSSVRIALPALCNAANMLYKEKQGAFLASELLDHLHRAIFK